MGDIGTRDNQRVSKGASQNNTRRSQRFGSRLGIIKGTTISFTSTATVGDSGSNFDAIEVGDVFQVKGSPLNSRQFEVTARTMTAAAVKASGSIAFHQLPTAEDTITLNGTAVTFKASGATGDEVDIVAASLSGTLAALLVVLQASEDVELVKFTYAVNLSTSTLSLEAATAGTAGNSLTIASSNAAQIRSAATLLGGLAAVSADALTVLPAFVQTEAAGAAIQIERVG